MKVIQSVRAALRGIRLGHIERLGQAMSGFATLAAAGLAFYAYFFSSLPEEMTRQYNSQIAKLNEETKGLMRERSTLSDDVVAAKQELDNTKQRDAKEREDSIKSLQDLQVQLASLEVQKGESKKQLELLGTQLKAMSDLRDKYANSVAGHQLFLGGGLNIFFELERLGAIGKACKDIAAYRKWAAEDEGSNAYYSDAPKDSFMMDEALFGRNSGSKSAREILSKLIETITKSQAPFTGRDLLLQHISEKTFSEMSPADAKRAMAAVKASMDENKTILSQPLNVVVPAGATDDEIAQKGDAAAKAAFGVKDYFGKLMDNISLKP